MKLPKIRPGRQDGHGEFLVGILSLNRPIKASCDTAYADLWFPVSLEPFRTQPARQ